MDFKNKILACALAASALYACQTDRIEIPPEEQFTREFIKEFGIIDPSHDWSLIKQASINVSTPSPTDIKIYTLVDGKTILLADYHDVDGSQTLTFDVIKSVDKVLVRTDNFFEEVALGSTINLSPQQKSRGSNGTDNLATIPQIKNGFFREYKFVEAFNRVLPEYGNGGRALKNHNVTADFSFVSNGQPFVFYPIYWNTGAKNTLGVYWYENGELKTQDLFNNYDLDASGNQVTNNMYRKSTQTIPDLVVTGHTPADKATEIPLKGTIEVEFNLDIKMTQWGRATLRLASNPTGSQAFLKNISASGKKATFTYEGLSPNTEYVFSIPERRFVPTAEKEGTTNYSKALSFTFTTHDTALKLVSVSPADDKASEKRTNGKSGIVTLTYNNTIEKTSSTDLPTMVSVDGKHHATVTGPEISGNTMKFQYSGAEYDTPYDFTVPEGIVHSTEDVTSSNNLRIFRFMTMVSPDKYTYNDALTNVPLITNSKNDEFTKDQNVVGTDAPFTATLTRDIGSKDKKQTKETWTFNSGFSSNYFFGIRCVDKVTPSELQPLAGGAYGSGYTLMLIKPTQSLKLTIYYGYKPNDKTDRMLFIPRIYDQTSFRIFDTSAEAPAAEGTDRDTYEYTHCSYELRANRTYLLYCPKDSRVAGFSYQTVKEIIPGTEPTYDPTITTFATSKGRSRSEETATPIYDHQMYETEQDIIDAGYSKITYADGRISSYINYVDGKGGKDNVVTHQISITLPAGRVFGFYIRNNSGAANITYSGSETPKPYYNYSMSSMNKDMDNSFFNSLMTTGDATHYANGWTKFDKIDHDVDENRKYCTSATYTVNIDGDDYRYFSFEDWLDCDFNDIVFLVDPQSDSTPIDMEVDTNPCIVAVEDMGATNESDIDFNDIVFAVEHVAGQPKAFVTMLASGGSYESQLLYNGKVVGKTGADGIGKVVAGPGMGKSLDHVNMWFDESSVKAIVNVGNGIDPGFGNLTTVEIDVDPDFSMAPRMEKDNLTSPSDNLAGFSVQVTHNEDVQTQITCPDGLGQVPQMLVIPSGWYWPKEGVAIHSAYPGGLTADGDRIASFQNWVSNQYEANETWYVNYVDANVVAHPWSGSDAARDYVRSLNP